MEKFGLVEEKLSQEFSRNFNFHQKSFSEWVITHEIDQIKATNIATNISKSLGIFIHHSLFSKGSSLGEVAQILRARRKHLLTPIYKTRLKEDLCLSSYQQQLIFLSSLDEEAGSAYNVIISIRLHGSIDVAALRQALSRIARRHEVLRTTYRIIDGIPGGTIGENEPELTEASAAVQSAESNYNQPLTARLTHIAQNESVLLLSAHHIAMDGWSIGLLFDELVQSYDAVRRGLPDPVTEPPIQYADYAAWLNRWVSSGLARCHAEYWRAALEGAPAELRLPFDFDRGTRWDFAGGSVPLDFDATTLAGVRRLGKQCETTLFNTLLTAWIIVMSRLSRQNDIVVGITSANRKRPEIQRVIGYFANTLPVRVSLEGDPSVRELLSRAATAVLDAQDHQELPFEQIVEAVNPDRRLATNPLCQVMFSLSEERLDARLPGLDLSAQVLPTASAKFDLTVELTVSEDGLAGHLAYPRSLFEPESARRVAEYFHTLVTAFSSEPDHLPALAGGVSEVSSPLPQEVE